MKIDDITVTRQDSDWDTEPLTYIYFEPRRKVASTVEHRLGVNIDLDTNGDIVGIEVLG